MGINWANMWSLESDTPEAKAEQTLWPFEHSLSPAEQREFLERAAHTIVKRRLTAPALLFLESLRPLSFIGSQALLVLRPLLGLALSGCSLQALLNLLEERQGVERLLELIERYDRELPAETSSPSPTVFQWPASTQSIHALVIYGLV